MRHTHYEAAELGAVEAGRWVGDEPVAVSAPVEAQITVAHALLAVVDEIRELRVALCDRDGGKR